MARAVAGGRERPEHQDRPPAAAVHRRARAHVSRPLSLARLLVRRPSPRLADGEPTHLERVEVDAALALAQWRAYVEAFRTRGEVVAVPVTRVLHLKSAVTALPDGTVIGWEPHVDDPQAFERFFGVPEEHGTAVVVLDERSVLMSADAPGTAELLRARGLEVVTAELSEFEKLEGCVTSLSLRLRDETGSAIRQSSAFAARRSSSAAWSGT